MRIQRVPNICTVERKSGTSCFFLNLRSSHCWYHIRHSSVFTYQLSSHRRPYLNFFLNSWQLRILLSIAWTTLVMVWPVSHDVLNGQGAEGYSSFLLKKNCWNKRSIQYSRHHVLERVNTDWLCQHMFDSRSPGHITVTCREGITHLSHTGY